MKLDLEARVLLKHLSEEDKVEVEERKKAQTAEEEPHSKAFQHDGQYVEEHFIGRTLVRITLCKEMWCTYMLSQYSDFNNKSYKINKLKDKRVKHFKFRINFWQRYPGTSDLVYSREIPTGQAVGVAFENATSEERTVIEAAMVIRCAVHDGCNESQQLPWPPEDKDLCTQTILLPHVNSISFRPLFQE
ncbi:hypothetical protein PoB_006224400 [Plakobranchus ocellatus]|uniref:Uncharacterized protein n=1 Tax=Plakobranchus ocellatus TaxID=259542 RepID=A0AAV4CV26_9GAST|nr:hypothetical protein PoB_006224400 [Plakobranchus ocellatus]